MFIELKESAICRGILNVTEIIVADLVSLAEWGVYQRIVALVMGIRLGYWLSHRVQPPSHCALLCTDG